MGAAAGITVLMAVTAALSLTPTLLLSFPAFFATKPPCSPETPPVPTWPRQPDTAVTVCSCHSLVRIKGRFSDKMRSWYQPDPPGTQAGHIAPIDAVTASLRKDSG